MPDQGLTFAEELLATLCRIHQNADRMDRSEIERYLAKKSMVISAVGVSHLHKEIIEALKKTKSLFLQNTPSDRMIDAMIRDIEYFKVKTEAREAKETEQLPQEERASPAGGATDADKLEAMYKVVSELAEIAKGNLAGGQKVRMRFFGIVGIAVKCMADIKTKTELREAMKAVFES